ncbi:MAG: MFS transporter [Melioribacteraceae bacterium]|nr:MFS transporter [Melioribacteraceae bacterium]
MHKNIYLALIGIGIGGIGFGLVTPVTVMLLEQNGASSFLTGSVTMIGYLSIVFFSSYTGRLIDKYKVKKILLAGLTIWMLGALAHVFWYVYPILFPVKFIMGIGGTFIFVSTEVMINYYSNETNRGKNISLYVVLLSVGVAFGTLLIWTITIADWFPFVIGSSIMFLVLVFEYFILDDFEIKSVNEPREKMRISEMPLMGLVAGIIYGLFESSIIVALPLFGLRNLFSTEEVSFFLASFVIGGVVLLYIIGHIADKINKFRLLLYISFILAILFIVPIFLSGFGYLLAAFFVMGGIVPAFYTVGLNYTVEKVDKKFMAQANGFFVMMYGVGTIAGPLAGSMMVEIDKQYGYWVLASGLCILFLLFFVKYSDSGK